MVSQVLDSVMFRLWRGYFGSFFLFRLFEDVRIGSVVSREHYRVDVQHKYLFFIKHLNSKLAFFTSFLINEDSELWIFTKLFGIISCSNKMVTAKKRGIQP